jgi:RNA polymerase sigma-70 factor (ECF subfamily)
VQPNRGDVAEIESLYRRYGSALLLFAAAITGERGRAQDVVQQVFLKLIEDGNLRQAADKKAYLFACVRNAVLNEIKIQQRNTVLDPETVWFNPPDRDYAAELNLRRALYMLPDHQRCVIVLHIWGELTFSEIASLLDISSNTVASRYRYALAKLRESMGAKSMLGKEDFCANS